jgi:DNA-binding NtrC family response regulator
MATSRRSLYRLNVFQHPHAAAEHKEDIPAILEAILADMNEKHERAVTEWTKRCSCLMSHDWPGNVRELRNTIERAVILCGEGQLESRHLPPASASVSSVPARGRRRLRQLRSSRGGRYC